MVYNLNNFIEKAKSVHGDKYDYSKAEYVNAKTKVCIICPEHGEFWQTPDKHLRGRGCSKCNNGVKYTNDDFIRIAKSVHGDKYDYSKVNYINASTNVCIICPEHGEFWQKPMVHLRGSGCQMCWALKKSLIRFSNTSEFVSKAVKIHGDKYDYSKVDYFNSSTKVCIICPEHGEFWQTPNKHLSGEGCPECAKISVSSKLVMGKKTFVDKANLVHNGKYDYSKVEYVNAKTKVCIICPEHGEFWQTPANHLNGKGCPRCVKKVVDTESFINESVKVHGNKYDYSEVKYVNSNVKVKVICPIHGAFETLPGNHIHRKYGCPICNSSHLEDEISLLLDDNSIQYVREKRFDWLGKQELDFYLPEYNIAIECQGKQHFKDVPVFKDTLADIIERDKRKNNLCSSNNVRLLYYSNKTYGSDYFIYTDKDKLLEEILKNS